MIEALEVVRDEDGGFTHPEWAELLDSLGDMEHLPLYIKSLFEKSHGCTIEVVSFESSVELDSAAWLEYNDGTGGFSSWELEPPAADAVLLSIHDTEDMPVQWWAVPCVAYTYDLVAHLDRQRAFSIKAFGPGARVEGISDHIKKELVEVAAAPKDISEWIDIVLLGLDGAWRAGHSSWDIADALAAKLVKNEARQWPDWRAADPAKAIEHNREVESNA